MVAEYSTNEMKIQLRGGLREVCARYQQRIGPSIGPQSVGTSLVEAARHKNIGRDLFDFLAR